VLLVRLLLWLEDNTDQQRMDRQQLVRMLRAAMHFGHCSARSLLCCSLASCDIQPHQLAGLIEQALRKVDYQALESLLSTHPARQMSGEDAERVQLLGIAAAGRPASNMDDSSKAEVAEAAANCIRRLAELPGLDELGHEKQAALLRAAIQHQAVPLQHEMHEACLRGVCYGNDEQDSLLSGTPLDAAIAVLCKASTVACRGDADSDSGSDWESTDSDSGCAARRRSKVQRPSILQLPAGTVQELLLLAAAELAGSAEPVQVQRCATAEHC
jgi:hypothetical protein